MRLFIAIPALGLGLALADPAGAQSLRQSASRCTSGDVELAIQSCSRIIRSSRIDRKNKAVAYINRGNAYSKQGDLDRAIDDFTKAIKSNSRNLVAFYNRGNAHIVQENFDQAIIDFSRAISLQRDHVLSYNGRGNAYLAKGETERAIAEYNKALEIDPNNTQAASNRALAYTRDGDIVGVFRNFAAVVKVFFRSLFNRK
jgi:tetratricopeptide (TPR) repeat protein